MELRKIILVNGMQYRHFEGTIYKIIAIATHATSGETFIVYESPDHHVFTEPYDHFVQKVDRKKYPEATQKFRFEAVGTK